MATDDGLEQGSLICLNSIEFGSVCLGDLLHARAASERLRHSHCGRGLHKYADQVRTVLFRECTSKFHDTFSPGPTVDEHDDFTEVARFAAVAKCSFHFGL
jgi:hypothetical protein